MTAHGVSEPPPSLVTAEQRVIVELLQRAALAETQSQGPDLRVAFRITRYLIEGAIRSGLASAVIADALGVKPDTVRSRRGIDGLLGAEVFARLADITEGDIERWRAAGQIERLGPDLGGTIGYRASSLIAARMNLAASQNPQASHSRLLVARGPIVELDPLDA
ncbi:hypothetical protein ITJ66_16745 [Plantibacter sp. VKM Ac-2885]|uniref:hypothetical protein n=1 Tax=Plantibacter sp. VKM Ac-2885 TaxID=2783828 RepID=UPI00188C9C21|nr:hypothetical protein [Plantibacter sp. VKM Ac-2885]MBF4514136.1 hypothetical protein [Plantibacter sp. VKM Ac-2885]